MIEKKIIKKSISIMSIILAIIVIVGIYLNSISYPIGYLLGYLISLLIFKLTASRIDFILKSQNRGLTYMLVMIEYIGKLIIYALGLLLGIVFKEYVNYWCVFIGYFTIKITILVEAGVERRKSR